MSHPDIDGLTPNSNTKDWDAAESAPVVPSPSEPASIDESQLAGRGAVWAIIAQGTQQALSIVATMILARLLAPADFGIVAAAVIVTQLAQLVLGLGWAAAIVRRTSLDDDYVSSVFWVLLAAGAVIAAVIALTAPFATIVLGVPDAAPYLIVLGMSCIPGAPLVVPQSLLQRRLDLAKMHRSAIVGVLIYVIVQISLAWLGAGAWSIIIGLVVLPIVQLVTTSFSARWRPSWVFRPRLLAGDARFAGGVLLSNGLTYGIRNTDYFVVGPLLGASALGAYYVAYVLPQILRLRATWAAGSVLYPLLARSRADLRRTQQLYDQTHLLLGWVGFPAMVGLAVLAEPIILVFFGPQWDAAVAPLRWLAGATVIEFITFSSPLLAMAHGQVRRLVATNVVRLAVLVILVTAAGLFFGSLNAVAAGVFLATLIWAFHQHLTVVRPLGITFVAVARGLLVIAALSLIMGALVGFLLIELKEWPPVAQLAVCVVVGAAVYFGLGLMFFRRTTFALWRMVGVALRRQRPS